MSETVEGWDEGIRGELGEIEELALEEQPGAVADSIAAPAENGGDGSVSEDPVEFAGDARPKRELAATSVSIGAPSFGEGSSRQTPGSTTTSRWCTLCKYCAPGRAPRRCRP